MKSVRKLSLLLLAVLFAITLVACNSGDEEGTPAAGIKVTVNAYDLAGDPVVLGDITLTTENPTVLDALQAMCDEREMVLVANELGLVEKIGEVGTSTYVDEETGVDMAIGWAWQLNDADVEGFANETVVKEGDTIKYYQYTYENEEETWVDPDAEENE